MSAPKRQPEAYVPVTTGAPWLQAGNPPQVVTRRMRIRRRLKRIVLVLLLTLLIAGGFLGWKFYQNASKITGNKNPLSLLGLLIPSPLKTTNGRVNILLAGYSADDAGHAGAELTDSIMIISIDQANKTALVMSVPRDLYLDIPGHGYSKINAAYQYGKAENFSASGYADGGMGLLAQTLTQYLGVDFNYQALLNYTAFRDAVNAVGGVTINIQSKNPRGLYDPNTNLKLLNGMHTLNGQQALDLARSRGDGRGSYGFAGGDFDRTTYQQQLLVALKDKGSSGGVIANPLKIVELANSAGNNVKTDMTVGELLTLYNKAKSIPNSSITQLVLNDYNGRNYLRNYTTATGQSALIPAAGLDNYSAIQELLSDLLTVPTQAR